MLCELRPASYHSLALSLTPSFLISPITNNATDIVFKNPFGFSLTVEEAGGGFTIAYKGVDAALLNLPLQKVVSSETSTGQPVSSSRRFTVPRLY